MKIIAAISIDGAIGQDNSLLWKLSEDLKRYKEKTMGNILIVGRKTYDSLPLGALKGRTHIVIKHDNGSHIDAPEGCDVHCVYSVEEAINRANELREEEQEVYVIGGSQIYNMFLDRCDEAEITWINKMYPQANKKFPIEKLFEKYEITGDSSWVKSDNGISYKFTNYKRN